MQKPSEDTGKCIVIIEFSMRARHTLYSDTLQCSVRRDKSLERMKENAGQISKGSKVRRERKQSWGKHNSASNLYPQNLAIRPSAMFTDIIINSYLNGNKITCWQEISHARTCRCTAFCPGPGTLCAKFKIVDLLKLHGVVKGWQLGVLRGVSKFNRSFYNF